MKKEYFSPKTFIVECQPVDVITASQGLEEDKDVTGNYIYNGFED